MDVQFFQLYLLRRLSVLHWIVFSSVSEISCHNCVSVLDSLFGSSDLYVCLSANTTVSLLLYLSHSAVSNSLQPRGLQHARLPCPSLSPGVCSNSCPLSQWCHPTISSLLPLSLPALNLSQHQGLSFPLSRLSPPSGQSTGASASVSVLPMNIQDWFPLGWTGWIFLQSKGLSRVFSSTTVQKHQFFGAQCPILTSVHEY